MNTADPVHGYNTLFTATDDLRSTRATAHTANPRKSHKSQKMSVLYNGTQSLFEQAGFSYIRPKGTKNCVMRKQIP